jgi:hypothetical protein
MANGDPAPAQLAQGPQFIAQKGMGGSRALLHPPDVQDGLGEIDREQFRSEGRIQNNDPDQNSTMTLLL